MSEESVTGRPTLYKAEYCEELVKHMASGLSYESFAGVVGVCKQTIYNWEADYPEFLDAKGRGTEQSRLFWEKLCIDNILNRTDSEYQGGSSSRSLNSQVWSLNMINRFGWKNKAPGEDDKTIKLDGAIKVLPFDVDDRVKQLKGES